MSGEPWSTTEVASLPRSRGDLSAFALEELIGEIAEGDHRAFACFYDQLAEKVWGVAFRVLRDRAQAVEVTQRIFTELWRTAALYTPETGSVTTWAMTVTHRRAVERVRFIGQAGDRIADDDSARQPPECLDRLSEWQREMLVLGYYDSLTCHEIAESHQLAAGVVGSGMRDALHRLRSFLETR